MTQDFDKNKKRSKNVVVLDKRALALCPIKESVCRKRSFSHSSSQTTLCVLFPAPIGLEKEIREREREKVEDPV